MTKKSLHLSTVLSTSAFCAALAVAPVINLISSARADAAAGNLGAGVCDETINDGQGTILWQNIRTLNSKLNNWSLYKESVAYRVIPYVDNIENGTEKYSQTIIDVKNIQQYVNVDTIDWETAPLLDIIKAAMQADDYDNNLDLKKAISRISDHLIGGINNLKKTMSEVAPDIEISSKYFYKVIEQVPVAENSHFELYEFDDAVISDILNAAKSVDLYEEVHEVSALRRQIQNACIASAYWEYESTESSEHGRFVTKEEVYLLMEKAIAAAKKIDPSFSVELLEDKDTDNSDDEPVLDTPNTPSAPTQLNSIENSDKNIRVSGVNIDVSYTLSINAIADNLLKLMEGSFKNSTNQIFYDIYIRDNQDNIINDTGEVTVYIKIPSNMNIKSKFAVYYVPVATNGQYLTDQIQEIKDIKVNRDGWLTFQTNHFSVYGIVEYPENKAPNTGIAAYEGGSVTIASIKTAARIASVLTAAGIVTVIHRQNLRRKNMGDKIQK